MSSNEWKQVSLGEIALLNYGKSLTASRRIPGSVPVYSSSGLIDWHNETLVDEPGLVVGRKGNVGSVFYSNVPFFCIDTAYFIRQSELKGDLRFLFYLLQTLGLEHLNEDSAVPGLNRDTAYSQEFLFPHNIETQKRITGILSALDEKIALNRQMNATLEAIAQAIFREWFVQYNYPGAAGDFVESELGLIPAGWRVGTLGNEGDFKNGINYSRDENGDTEFSIVNVRDVVGSKFISKDALNTVHIDKKKAKPYLLEANDILLVRSASPGETAISLRHEDGIIYSGFTIRYRLFDKTYFLYLFFVFLALKNNLNNLANGTTLKNITQGLLNPYQIVIPDEQTVRDFNTLIESIFQTIESNSYNSRTLAQIRDALLPKLMRGEIAV